MANKDDKQELNVGGKYFVDTECIDCDVCRQTAPDYFKANEDDGYSYVFKQPESDEGVAECEEALEACPVEAIGNDGE
jgi:ferredoxin